MIEARQIAERLGGPKVLGTEVTSDLQFYRIMDQGFAPQVIDALIRNQVISRQELNKLAIAPRTLARRKAQHENLTAEESDRVIRIARIVAYAEEVFGDRATAAGWLREANRALDGQIPLEMVATEMGARLVETVLDRLAHGRLP
jgi:putative toxin-antitoxin system antitoxin component (TIGR02293 family)